MALRGGLELEVRISSAKDVLEDVSLGGGPLQAYVVVCVSPNREIRTGRSLNVQSYLKWDERPRFCPVDLVESPTVHFHLYRYNESGDGTKISSTSFDLRDITDNVGFGEQYNGDFSLRRPSGRFQGTLSVSLTVHKSTSRSPSAPYTNHTTQPLPTRIAGTADASRMRNNRHHRRHQKLEMRSTLVVSAVALCLQLWAFFSYVEFKNKEENKEERFLMIIGMGVGMGVVMIIVVLGMLALMLAVDDGAENIANDVADRVENGW